MSVARVLAFFACLAFSLFLRADELSIARAALRDGLWDVARLHAVQAGTNETARLVVLESLAREERWDDIRKQLTEWGAAAKGAAFDYYRAVAADDRAAASAALRAAGTGASVAAADLLDAAAAVHAGNRAKATALWRAIVASTNAGVRTRCAACINLRDVALLRRAYGRVRIPELRHRLGLTLGACLVAETNATSFAEGERLVRGLVQDAPDAPGAREAFVALAEAHLAAQAWEKAAKTYSDAVEIWPAVAKDVGVQEGLGWALFQQGRRAEALACFQRVEGVAKDGETRARALTKQGDILASLGKIAESTEKYRAAIACGPNSPTAELVRRIIAVREREQAGRTAYRRGDYALAERAFAEVAAADATRRDRMDYLIVLCLYGQGLDEKAGAKARQLATTCPTPGVRADATLWYAKFLYNQGRWKEAADLFERRVGKDLASPKDAEALLWAARAAFADHDFARAVAFVTRLLTALPENDFRVPALLLQGESLIELARFDEAVLVLERALETARALPAEEVRARILRADALFAMGADNALRYEEALEAYRTISFNANLELVDRIPIAFKIGRTLEKLKRTDEAIDQYYTQVVLAYRDGRQKGIRFGDEARAAFSRAAFRLADEYEGRGGEYQTARILRLVAESDVPAAEEARKRLERLSQKGWHL